MEERDEIDELILESGLDPAEYTSVVDALTLLADVVPADAPAPSAELAALLSGGVVTPLRADRPARPRLLLASAVAATVVVGTGVAAAANTLPDPVQRFLHDVTEKVLPSGLEVPSPDDRSDNGNRGEPTSPNGFGRDGESATNPGKHLGELEDKPGADDPGQGTDNGKKPDEGANNGKPPEVPSSADNGKKPDDPTSSNSGQRPDKPEKPEPEEPEATNKSKQPPSDDSDGGSDGGSDSGDRGGSKPATDG